MEKALKAKQIYTWLYHAVNSRLEDLELKLTSESFALPLCVRGCKSLSCLNLDTTNGILKLLLALPTAGCAITNTLQILALDSVQVQDNYFG